MRWPTYLASLLAVMAAYSVGGCNSRDPARSDEQTPSTPSPRELPTFELKDDTPNLLLTWIDESGDFHVARKPTEVPEKSREKVRVVSTERREGTGSMVYVADLRTKQENGTYRVATSPRSAWDELGASRRKSRMESLAPELTPGASAAPRAEGPLAASPTTVVIYGAKWCGACREAARYLKQQGVKFLEKDVDESPLVQRELQAKLRQAGMPPSSSIPILDVGGKLIVGFNPATVDRALREASSSPPL